MEATGLNTYADVTVVCGEMRRTEQRPSGHLGGREPTKVIVVPGRMVSVVV